MGGENHTRFRHHGPVRRHGSGHHRDCGRRHCRSAASHGLDSAQRRSWRDRRLGTARAAPHRAIGWDRSRGRCGWDCALWCPRPCRLGADAHQATAQVLELVGPRHRIGGLHRDVPHLVVRGRAADQRPRRPGCARRKRGRPHRPSFLKPSCYPRYLARGGLRAAPTTSTMRSERAPRLSLVNARQEHVFRVALSGHLHPRAGIPVAPVTTDALMIGIADV